MRTTCGAPGMMVFIVTLLAFARVLSAGFVWDDWLVLPLNPRINPPSVAGIAFYWTHLAWNLYEPLTCGVWEATAFISHAASGGQLLPFWFHLVQLLLHAAAALAVYRLLRLIGFKPRVAMIAAGMFAVHPIQTEAVAFIGAMNNPLFGCLAILAIADYLIATSPASTGQPARRKRHAAMRGTLLFVLAMCAKPTAVVTPVAAALLDWAVHRRSIRSVARSAAPWIVLSIPFVLVTKFNQHGMTVGADGSAMVRPLVALDAIAVQLWHIVAPFRLTIDYGRSPAWLAGHPAFFLTGMVTVALLAFAWSVRKHEPLLVAAIGFFVTALLPNSGLAPFDFQVNSTVTDRYAYLPMAGVAVAAAWAIRRWRWPGLAISAGVLGLLLGLSVYQSGFWRDDVALAARAVEVNPNSVLGFENLSFGLLGRDPARAVEASRQAVRLAPASPFAWNGLGNALLASGNSGDARSAFAQAVNLEPTNAHARQKLGRLLDDTGDKAGAIAQYRAALDLAPTDAGIACDLAAVLAEGGQLDEAIALYQRALKIDPQLLSARQGIQMALAAKALGKSR